MPLQSHGRVCLAVALCFVALFCVVKFQYNGGHGNSRFRFMTQYSNSGKALGNGIENDTLGFEKIFVINAPWRTDRKDSISLAASYSGVSLDWIDGVDAEDIREKAYPPGNHRQIPHGNLGSWRAHMDAVREIIAQNLSTALILEDDADWDFRIRGQLLGFSQASRKLPEIIKDAETHDEKHIHVPASEGKEKLDPVELAKRSSTALSTFSARHSPKADPYGRDWDILWLGHCGAKLPPASPHHPNRLMHLNDPTVPAPQFLKPMRSRPVDEIASLYPPQTRIYHRTNTTLCTLAYAVTQRGARKILYQHGIREFSKGYDFALSDYCNGLTRDATKTTIPMCLTVNPPIFAHYFGEEDGGGGARGGSDITGTGAGGKETGTRYVRVSVRANLEGLVRGGGVEGVREQWGSDDAK